MSSKHFNGNHELIFLQFGYTTEGYILYQLSGYLCQTAKKLGY